MGCFLSKKTTSSSLPCVLPSPSDLTKTNTESEKNKYEEETLKNEIFVIKQHRKSHEIERRSEEEKGKVDQKLLTSTSTTTTTTTTTSNNTSNTSNFTSESAVDVSNNNGGISSSNVVSGGVVVRTSSCTKEEVDAILIQCGRLSRSSSTGKAADTPSNSRGGRKYSGSKRSYDFDHETPKGNAIEDNVDDCNVVGDGDEAVAEAERIHRHRQRQRQSRTSPSSSQRRRRTPSRERDQQQQQLQRSGSRERGGNSGSSGGGGRRLSKSPGRRSESPIPNSGSANANANASASGSNNRPGKMVSVPATVSSLAMDKSNNGTNGTEAPPSSATVKRISVKRNAGDTVAMGSRTASSPRSRSPARTNNVKVSIENQNAHSNQSQQQQPLSLSRSNSRKADQSPYRRNPLSEIDQNSLGFDQLPLPNNKIASNNNVLSQTGKGALENKLTAENCRAKEQQKLIVEEAKGLQPMTKDITVTEVASETLKQLQTLTRSRSSRRSRDLDINPELLLNSNPSYTSLLLEDIQNFHQKTTTTTTTSISLPACVTKACSILEAVADLNSSTSSNISGAFSDDKRCPATEQFNKKRLEIKDPIVESEVGVTDDLMEPSLHKYITVRRSTIGGADMEEQESSGSNSFVGGQQHWLASSSWEPNSADSNDCSASSRFFAPEDDRSPIGVQMHAFSKSGRDIDPTQRRSITKKQSGGIGRGKVGSIRGAAST